SEARFDVIQRNIELEIERVVGAIDTQYRLDRDHVDTLRQAVRDGKREIEEIGEKSFELSQLQRDVDANRKLYDTFFTRYRETNETRNLDTASAQIVEQAVVPLEPSNPNKKLILTLAFSGALVISVVIALLREIFDSSIDTVGGLERIESKLGVPLIGIVPLLKNDEGNSSLSLSRLQGNHYSVFSESIRRIASSILIGPVRKRSQVIVVSSSVPSEGKSTTAMNLAFELSKNERVLLIDADLRKPTVHKVLRLKDHLYGLSDALRGDHSLSDAIRSNAVSCLDVMTAGGVVEEIQRLLSSDSLRQLVNEAREQYDRVIIDTPPVHAVSDALHLSEVGDSVIYAVKSNETEMKLVEKGIEQFKSVDADIHGVVVTMVDIEKAKAYGGNYYAGYYDYYGYS
ncbi:MAG: polysaccharide biosynthesis tyrosine autokinase, partial [Pseudomonadota bacterium]